MDITSLALSKGYTNQKTKGMLRNTGYFNSKDELPQISQPSGKKGAYPSTFTIDPTKVDIQLPDLSNLKDLVDGTPLPYVVGAYLDEDNFIYVATDTPEYIESFSYSLDGSYCFRLPLTFYPLEDGGYGQAKVSAWYRCDGIDGMMPDFNNAYLFIADESIASKDWSMQMHAFHLAGMTQQGPGTIFGYIGGNGQARIFGNLPTKLKYKNHLDFSGKKVPVPPMGVSTPDSVEEIPNAKSDSLTLAFADNYTYTDGMDALYFDENYNAYWITGSNGAKTNDTAVVGENQLYIVNNNNEWQSLGGGSSDPIDLSSYATKQYVNEMLGVIENGSY
jgi:hypothetical protein